MKSQALLNESVGSGYIDRNWPSAFGETGAWPLSSLRQSFLNGSLTRLIDPDSVLKTKIVEFVVDGSFALASRLKPDGTYEHVWYKEPISSDEVAFESEVFLLKHERAEEVRKLAPAKKDSPQPSEVLLHTVDEPTESKSTTESGKIRGMSLSGNVPPEVWNRLGTKILPKLRGGRSLQIEVGFSFEIEESRAENLAFEIRQILDDLGLADQVVLH